MPGYGTNRFVAAADRALGPEASRCGQGCAAERAKRNTTAGADHSFDNMAGGNAALCKPNPSPKINFHDWGLYGADVTLPHIGPVKRLSTIMRELGHTHVDVLKADTEGGEWGAFGALDSKELALVGSSVSQLMLEIHMQPQDLKRRLSAMPPGTTPALPEEFSREITSNQENLRSHFLFL